MTSSDSREKFAVVLDVGTTNIRVVVFDRQLKQVFVQETVAETMHPHPEWAEQDPEIILGSCKDLLKKAEEFVDEQAFSIGITNQRESVVAWDKVSGQVLSQLILWSDKRTQQYCEALKARGAEEVIRYKTGLALTPYSSAPKMHWLLEQTDVKSCVCPAIGTLDSWLIFRLTGEFLTDYTNACRTMLYNIHTETWDDELLHIFNIPKDVLPAVRPSQSSFGSYQAAEGNADRDIRAVIGDQQASMYAAGTTSGVMKVTYGTGIFPMKIIGNKFALQDSSLTTLAISDNGEPTYALEGKVENAAPRVSKVYGIDKPAFDALMLELAHEAAPVIAGLVSNPGQEVYVDGGISQNDDILAEQEKLNHIKTRRLSTHNGSALGVAKLLLNTK